MRKLSVFVFFVACAVLVRAQPSQIYWAEAAPFSSDGVIMTSKIDGSNPDTIVYSLMGLYDMEVDFYGEKIFFGEVGVGIQTANLDGTGRDTIIPDPGAFFGIGLDLVNNKIYYYTATDSSIKKADFDGLNINTIFSFPKKPSSSFDEGIFSLQVNNSLNKLFWCEYDSGYVVSSNLDGSGIDTLLIYPKTPNVFASEHTEKLYISAFDSNKIMTANLDGSNLQEFVETPEPFAITVDNSGNKLYWANPFGNTLMRTNLDDGLDVESFITTTLYPVAIAFPTIPPVPVTREDTEFTFTIDDFALPEINMTLFENIKIIMDVDKGILYLDENLNTEIDAGEDVEVDDVITKEELDNGKLKFKPAENESGSPYASYRYKWYNGTQYSDSTYVMEIYVDEVNDASVLSDLETTRLYFREASADGVKLSSTITITDVDDDNIDSAKVQISVNYEVDEDSLFYDGDKAVTKNWDKISGTLTLKGTLAKAAYDSVLREVSYFNYEDTVTEGVRTISVTVFDRSDASNTLMREVMVSAKLFQSITFEPLDDKTYGDSDFELTAASGYGFLEVQFESSDNQVASVEGTTVTINSAGTAIITASQSGNDSIVEAQSIDQSLLVSKATLAVTADDKTRAEGEPNPALTITYTGWIGTDNEDSLDVKPIASTDANVSSEAGSYDITLSGGLDNNYDFDYTNGTLSITAVSGTNEISSESLKIYPNPVSTYLMIEGTDYRELDYEVYNVTGELLMKGVVTDRIDLTDLHSGVYLLKLNHTLFRITKQ